MELKNCPFCGSQPIVVGKSYPGENDILNCGGEDCSCMGDFTVEQWNRRALVRGRGWEQDKQDAERWRKLKAHHLQTGPDSWIRTGDDLEEAVDALPPPPDHRPNVEGTEEEK